MFNKNKTRRKFRQRRAESSDEDEGERESNEADTDQNKQLKEPISFTQAEPESDECFQVKRPVNKAVIFQTRKKEESPARLSASPQRGSGEVDVKVSSDGSVGSSAEEDVPPNSDSDSKSSSSSSSSSEAPTVNIPDGQKIRAIKEQRRRARAHRDYIPLEGDRESDPDCGEGQEKVSDGWRGSDDEPDDHERRIQFAPKSKTLRERVTEKTGWGEEISSDSQEEEDQHIWEEQQIGKGVQRHQKQSCPLRQKKTFALPETLPSVSINILKKRITGKLESLKEVHRAREAELRRMKLDIESARSSQENLENHPGDQQLRFYRSMNIFSQNLLECLCEKIPSINSVELDMLSLYADQAQSLLSQRRRVVQEESTHLQQLTYDTAAHSDRATLEETESLKGSSHSADEGGVPADLEPPAEQEAELQSRKVEILKQSQEIFADAQEDFSNVKKILSRFDEWRLSFPDSYNNAYIELCLPKLLGPLIRNQLIGWNPLKNDGEDLEALPWYSAVETFCYGQGYDEPKNVDKKTLPAIVEKTILPKMQGFVELVWDPSSSHQSQCLTSLCQRIREDFSVFREQSKPVQAFLEAVLQRLRSAVENDVFIPLYPKSVLSDVSAPQFQFQNQQFWCAVKLLRNMALWDGLVDGNDLKGLMLDKLLNRYLMMVLLNESSPKHVLHKCKKVGESFPASWFVDPSAGSSLPQLQNFIKLLVQTTHSLLKETRDITGYRAVLSDVMLLLGKIKAGESMEAIAQTYHCQDLLESSHKSL